MSAARPLTGTVPELGFAVLDAVPLAHAAAPTLVFTVRVTSPGAEPIRAVLLDAQLQIAARRRAYDPASHDGLFELFGHVKDWGTTLRTLLWTRLSVSVPPFTGSADVALHVPCSYDLDVLATRYFSALDDGEVPIELLFSGTVFYAGAGGMLQAGRISWEQDAEYRLPVRVWRETLDHHFRDTAWLRLRTAQHEALLDYRARHRLTSWEATVEALLAAEA